MRPVTLNQNNVPASLNEIERASHDADIVELAQNFTIGNSPTAQRVFVGSNVQLSATGVGNTNDTTEDTLFTFPLPANSLTLVGEGLSLLAAGTWANNAHLKTTTLYFGTDSFQIQGTNASATWVLRMRVYRSASKAQLILAEGSLDSVTIAPGIIVGAVDDTAGITIKVTGQTGTAAANDVVANMLAVDALTSDIGNAWATWIADCQKGGSNRTT
jgi:hypothetical protein